MGQQTYTATEARRAGRRASTYIAWVHGPGYDASCHTRRYGNLPGLHRTVEAAKACAEAHAARLNGGA